MQGRKYLSSWRVKSIIGVLILGTAIPLLFAFLWFLTTQDAGKSPKGNRSFFRHSNDILEKEGYIETAKFSVDLKADELKRKTAKRRSAAVFDFHKCRSGFKIFAHPLDEETFNSNAYTHVLNVLRRSKYYTSNPRLACIFVLTLDTLDRDHLSNDYVRNLELKIQKLTFWNNGANHLIFNLFSGTWPNYAEDLGFDSGHAIIARASISDLKFRYGFDISFPLFTKNHPYKDDGKLANDVHIFPVNRQYLAGFKGKRYLSGIGSDTRNVLHVLHNDKDMILLTTCKHGKGWQKLKDDRCDTDNANYDRYDYRSLLANATFCLIPRGRRLGSFRFLEALQTGCIPVVLSNGWELPFQEVIDWRRAVINVDERTVFHVRAILQSYKNEDILRMRQQGLFLWKTYFSSTEKIVSTTLEILKARLMSHQKQSYVMWNFPPGALVTHAEFSQNLQDFPFYYTFTNSNKAQKFTAMILATSPVRYASSPLFRLILAINQSQFVDQILVVWLPSTKIPDKELWPKTKVALRVIYPGKKSMNSRFLDSDLLTTDAIFSFDEDVVISQDEIDFAFKTWRSFPDRIVGFTSRSHYWHYTEKSWIFSSKKRNTFSFVMPNAAVFHRYYNYMYTNHLPQEMEELIDQLVNCEGIAFNFLVSKVSEKSPILLCSSHHFNGGVVNKEKLGIKISQEEFFKQERTCFKEFSRIIDSVPLRSSFVKIDPLLYKDPVSNFRKRYRLFEL